MLSEVIMSEVIMSEVIMDYTLSQAYGEAQLSIYYGGRHGFKQIFTQDDDKSDKTRLPCTKWSQPKTPKKRRWAALEPSLEINAIFAHS